MMRAAAKWGGQIDSRYDALLSANMRADIPENRWMVFSRCRIWTIFQGYSRELAPDCLLDFVFSYDNIGKWRFRVPASEGKYYLIELILCLDHKDNRMKLVVNRPKKLHGNSSLLLDDNIVNIIIRPDIEDRRFHDTIKAFKCPETDWPSRIKPSDKGFLFDLSNSRFLKTHVSSGKFIHEPEWHYMVHRSYDAQRGLDPDSDLFSPGYFLIPCKGGENAVLLSMVVNKESIESERAGSDNDQASDYLDSFIDMSSSIELKRELELDQAVIKSLDAFIVDRNLEKGVIAGYPWFLDWGRDSLVFCRCLIELSRFSEAKSILRLFGRFENKGTLPNMICGNDARNIETSDAPLWFIACCKDLILKEGKQTFLEERLGNRSVKDIIFSIAESMIEGTMTGVTADPLTMLIYSPSHFTWMDTNFPAGSPRQGYPVEIQALWYNALRFLESIDLKNRQKQWADRAKLVKASILTFFYKKDLSYFSDCLHCNGPVGAAKAKADDALRPNQLFLITLGVIEKEPCAVKCLESCMELIVPGAIRSLANRRVSHPIEIYHNNTLVKDPHYPYFGKYEGDEDSQRKPAYHNGTAWTWPFPTFCEAWAEVFGKESYSVSLAWLGSVIILMRQGAAGYISEILDGDYPHTPRGCDAQAWGSSETARVMHKLLAS